LEGDEFPVAEGEFAFSEGPDDPAFSGEAVVSASQLGGEHFACGEGSVAVARDGIEGVVDGVGEMFGETCGFSPAHTVEGEDIREGVAEKENVGAGVGAPES